MTIEQFIASKLSEPKIFKVTTTYQDGRTRQFETATLGQAENYAHTLKHKIGKTLKDRETGKTVKVISVTVSEI